MYLIEINVLQFPSRIRRVGNYASVDRSPKSDGVIFCLIVPIRHKSFTSHSSRRSQCSFTVRGKHGESRGKEKEEELEKEDLKREPFETYQGASSLIAL